MSNEKLNTVKPRPGQNTGAMPGSQAINQSLALSTSELAAQYLYEQCTRRYIEAGVSGQELYQQVLDVLNQHVIYRNLADKGSDIWGGQPVATEFQNVQSQLADGLLDNISISAPIRFDFALSRKGQLVCLFTAENVRLDADTESAMNKELIAWLAKHNLIHQDGVIYEATNKGEIKQRDGNLVVVNLETFKAQMADKKTGFKSYLQQQNQSINVDVHSQDFNEPESAQPSTMLSGGE